MGVVFVAPKKPLQKNPSDLVVKACLLCLHIIVS